jgi:hypothetical protein
MTAGVGDPDLVLERAEALHHRNRLHGGTIRNRVEAVPKLAHLGR